MPPPVPNADCWYGIEDAGERKKIQDRLAQRARRKRIAQQHETKTKPAQQSAITPSSEAIIECSPLPTMTFTNLPHSTSSSPKIIAEVPPSVFAALWDNGAMMGLTCGVLVPSKSSKVSSQIPVSLQPTALQLTTIHAPWIDRFPFPKMRDNLISLSAIVDDEEFLRDLFSVESFVILPGKAGWDPTGWVMSEIFKKKWGYLMY